MKTVTYHGPGARLIVGERTILRGCSDQVPNHAAEHLLEQRNINVTVTDGDEPEATGEGQTESTTTEEDA